MAANISSLSKGLIAHYPLNGEYETKDATPNANHGTNNGATLSTGRKGEANGSYEFINTQNDRILVNKDLIGTGNITTSAWFYAYSLGEESAGRIVATENYWIAVTTGNKFYASSVGGAPMPTTEVNSFRLNTWNHIVLTRNSDGLMNFYLNGVLIGLPNQYSGTPKASTTTLIGNSPLLNRDFDGKISDVKIYNRILEEDEIKLLYDSFKPEIATSDLNKGLVGHWMLDSENGAKDLTPNGNHGTANGGITIGGTTDRKGKTGGATSFDGVDDFILTEKVVNETNPSEFTIHTKFYLKGVRSSYDGIISLLGTSDTSVSGGITLNAVSTNTLRVRHWNDGGTNYVFGVSDLLNNWHEAAIVINNKNIKIYADAELKVDDSFVGDFNIRNGKFGIGVYYAPAESFFNGKVSDVRYYNRALSADEIKLLYDQYKPKEASIGSLNKGLVLDMPLTQKHMKSATVVSDRTPYGNDGTVNGATVGSEYTSFDGVNDYVEITGDFLPYSSSNRTISVWAKPNELLRSNILGYGQSTNGNMFDLLINDNIGTTCGHFYGSTFDTITPDSPIINLNEWNLITITYNGSTAKVYHNGQFANSKDVILNTLNSSFYIGKGIYMTGGVGFFKGQISNVKIWNRALSEEEVKLLYEKGRY